MHDFDVVVIGSGMGGLSAAASLASSGKKVLVLEKHNVPGGCATSFLRGRFEFEVALHELSGLGTEDNQGPLYRILSKIGVYPKVEFVKINELFHSYFPDFQITVPSGRTNFEQALCNQFPSSKDAILIMSATIFNFAAEYVKARRIGVETALAQHAQFPTFVSCYGKTMDKVINPIIRDEKVRAVFGQMWSYLCVPPATCSFDIYAMLMSAYITFGPAHIHGTSQALSQAFVDTIEGYGGEVWLNNGAKKIVVIKDRVSGVITSSGLEVSAPYVVCNANPMTVCYDLIGTEHVPGWYLNRVEDWTSGGSFFIVYLGLDRPYADFGVKTHESFINLSYDLNRQYELCSRSLSAQPDGAALTVYNAADKRFSPTGTSSIVLCLLNYTDPWIKLSGRDYVNAKNEMADKLVSLGERVIPGLRDSIEEMEVATPLTTLRYTGSPGGSVVGFDENFRVTTQKRLPSRGPLQGLYFSSAWVNMGGGFEVCIETGNYTGRDVLRDIAAGGQDKSQATKLKAEIEKESSAPSQGGRNRLLAEREAVRRTHADRLKLKVKDVIRETASASTIRMEPVKGGLPYFRAGQYLSLIVNINGVITNRPYSISSAPGKPYYDVTVRRMPGGFVSHYLLDKLQKGDVLEASGPHGSFYYEPVFDAKNRVFLAGGSGITPFMSMIREAVELKNDLNIHLIYGSRIPKDIIFGKELEEIAKRNANIKVDFVISEPPAGWKGMCGFLDAKLIQSLIGSIDDKIFMLCGPGQMHDLCDAALQSLGVPLRRIRKEVSGPPADISLEAGWPGIKLSSVFNVVEKRSGKAFKALASEPLLISMEKAGLVVPSVCRSGACTACRTKLLKGSVFAPQRVLKRWIDDTAHYIHPCMSYPLEDLVIRL